MTRLPDDVPDPEQGDDLGGGGVDVEAAWAQIVAHWSEEAAPRPKAADPARAGDDGPDHLLDITDVTDAARTRRPAADAIDGLGAAPPAASREMPPGDQPPGGQPPGGQPLRDDPSDMRTGDEPFVYPDYLDHPDFPPPVTHRLTPEEVAELADETWRADADRLTDDRRSTQDWRRSLDGPSTSHVGGEEARGSSASLDDDVEGFVPPEPPPLPRGDLVSRLAWGGALGAPLFLLIAALFWRDAPEWLVGAAVVAFVAGFVALVVRMPDRSDDEDGAVV